MRSKTREPFLMIPDCFITEGEETHLTETELYLYSLLLRKKSYEGVTETSIAFLYETSPIEFGSSKQRSLEEIKKILQSLVEREIISICNGRREELQSFKLISPEGEIIKEYKPSELIVIVFLDSTKKGHTEVDYSEFDKFNEIKKATMSDYYIYVATLKWIGSGNGNFNCSYERWRRILQVSERSARTKVNEAVKKKFVYKKIGKYKDELVNGKQKKQEKNSYRTTPFNVKDEPIMANRNPAKSKAKTIPENVHELF